MTANHFSEGDSPRQVMRGVVDLCADCDTCRSLMERECLFFPELYRLADREKEQGVAATGTELRALTTLCTLCGMCPCPNVRGDIIKSKSRYVEEEGVPLPVRLLVDIPRAARICGAFPRLSEGGRKKGLLGPLLRKLIGLHPKRHLPDIPPESFFDGPPKRE